MRYWVRVGLGLLAVVLLVAAVVREWPRMAAALRDMDARGVALAFLVVLVALVFNMLSWRALLCGFGASLPLTAAARLYFLAQLGKYLPGSVWPFLAQVELGREYHVRRVTSATAAGLNLILNLVTGVFICVAGLGLTASSEIRDYWWVLLILPFLVAVLHPIWLQRSMEVALRLARRPLVVERLEGGALVRAAAWSVCMWVLFGVHVALLARPLYIGGWLELTALSTGAYAAAWVVGFLVIFAPAGAGPREAMLVIFLTALLTRPEALAVAVVSRVVGTIGDFAVAGVGLAAEKVHRARSAEPCLSTSLGQVRTASRNAHKGRPS